MQGKQAWQWHRANKKAQHCADVVPKINLWINKLSV